MSENPNLTPEQKEKNQQYILDHLEEYIIDVHGNFFNIRPELLGNEENSSYCYIGKNSLTSEGNKEIRGKMAEMILREIKDWELITDSSKFNEVLGTFRDQKSGREINVEGFVGDDFEMYYKIVGELGYRENIWKNYEEEGKDKERRENEWKKWWQENVTDSSNNNQSTPPKTETKKPTQENHQNQTPPPPSENNPSQTPNPKKPTNNPNEPDKNNPSPEKEKNNSDNSSLPSPSEIQNQYNSDKSKSEIENNSNLTNQEQKNQAQELLKVIITAELLVKETKFNPEILTKLTTEKKNNTFLYQLLNKEGRIDQVISQLENIEKSQKNNNNSVSTKNQKSNNQVPAKIIWGGISFCLVLLIIRIWITKSRKKPK